MGDDTADSGRPEWWNECAALKEAMDLPSYQPPRFRDGVRVHTVVDDLEERYDGTIRLMGVNTSYPDDWEVRFEGRVLFTISRRRDDDGNTVYGMTAEQFERNVEQSL